MDSTSAYIDGPGSTPIEQVDLSTGTIKYLVSDALGSARGVVSSTGSLTASTNYDAWGNPETSGGLSSYTPIGFAGGYTDPTGLVYLVHRYYDPGTGQFLSVDPLVNETDAAFSYAEGDPVNQSDPSGLAVYSQCARLPAGAAQSSCDVGVLYSQEYGPISGTGVATLAATGAIGGATIGAAVGGPAAPLTATIGGILGGISGGITGWLEGSKAADSYITGGYIQDSVGAVLSILYLDNVPTEPSNIEISQMGGLQAYEWAVLSQSPQFQWFDRQLSTKLVDTELLKVLADYIKSKAQDGMSPTSFTQSYARGGC
jgi:RHS repeat-associated protein